MLTNGGPFHRELEQALCDYLGVEHISLLANGTIALMIAMRSLSLSGEVITTPYSFVATSHALLWNALTPVFVDVDPETLNIDPERIEAAITPGTTAILAVHCYGRPCNVRSIQSIADKYNLRVVYDAAHAFGVQCDGATVLDYGDLAVLSFHATKVFNTFEGGAIVCRDAEAKARIDLLKNFGIHDDANVIATGLNGKMSEFNAALGLLQLKYIDGALAARKEVDSAYRLRLQGVRGIRCLGNAGETGSNYAYFPILVEDEYPFSRDALWHKLKANGVYARRYFYPLISEFPMYCGLTSARPDNVKEAMRVSRQVLCLPIYPDLDASVIDEICAVLTS